MQDTHKKEMRTHERKKMRVSLILLVVVVLVCGTAKALDCTRSNCTCDQTTCAYQCGNGIWESEYDISDANIEYCLPSTFSAHCTEECDSGAFNGYLYDGVCCAGCRVAERVVEARTCSVDADCASEYYPDTDHICVGGWCSYRPANFASEDACPRYPCYVDENVGEYCYYTPYTGALDPVSYDCLAESVCSRSYSCVSGAVVGVITDIQAVTLPESEIHMRCTDLTAVAAVFRESTVNSVPPWNEPHVNYALDIDYGWAECGYNLETEESYFSFDYSSDDSDLADTCRLVASYTSQCGQVVLADAVVHVTCCGDGHLQPRYEQCDGTLANCSMWGCCNCKSNRAVDQYCEVDADCVSPPFFPGYDPTAWGDGDECFDYEDWSEFFSVACDCGSCRYAPKPVSKHNSSCEEGPVCPDYPCWAAECHDDGAEQSCQYAPVDNMRDFCTYEDCCSSALQCRDGTVVSARPHFEVIPQVRPLSDVYCSYSYYFEDDFDVTWEDVGLCTPDLRWSLELEGPCPLEPIVYNYDHVIFTGPWNASAGTSSCDALITAVSACGETRVFRTTYEVACCGDGHWQPWSGEQCDIGPAGNNQSATCCTEFCQFRDSDFICRPSEGPCDYDDYCSGEWGHCPPDERPSADYLCAANDGDCFLDSHCDGVSVECPTPFAAAGAPCNRDGDLCTLDVCDGAGACLAGGPKIPDDGLFCNGVEFCNPFTGELVVVDVPLCDDNNSCTADSCSDAYGRCLHTPLEGTYGPCGSVVGVCSEGFLQCDGSGASPVVECVDYVGPSGEACNGLDDNCNGVADEGCASWVCANDGDCAGYPHGGECQTVYCDLGVSRCAVANTAYGSPCSNPFDQCFLYDFCNGFGTCVDGPVARCFSGSNPCMRATCERHSGRCDYECLPADAAVTPGFIDGCETQFCGNDTCALDYGAAEAHCPASGDPCWENVCAEGSCYPVPLFGACDDRDPCTENDRCFNFTCSGTPVVCRDYLPCTNSHCADTGECVNTLIAERCLIDGKCYTEGDAHPESSCFGCVSAVSVVEWTPLVGSACDDGNPCTVDDYCNFNDLVCEGWPLDCSFADSWCAAGTCEPFSGECVAVPANEGMPCDDNLDGTHSDRCDSAGECVGTVDPAYCPPSTDCVDVYYDSSLDECVRRYRPDWITPCPSPIPGGCRPSGFCYEGYCFPQIGNVDCPHTTQCISSYCDIERGCVQQVLQGFACDTGNVCFPEGRCDGDGVCATVYDSELTLNCDDDSLCTADFCSPALGCYHEQPDFCPGTCRSDLDCPWQPCRAAQCVNDTCVYRLFEAGTSCGDGNVCNGAEACDARGVCVLGRSLVCDDANPCTDDSCHPQLGCQFAPNDNNAPNVTSPCRVGARCENGATVSEPLLCEPQNGTCVKYVCADQYYLNEPLCVPVPYPAGTPCTDDDPYTLHDVCDGRANCVGTPVVCPPPAQCQSEVVYNLTTGRCEAVWEPFNASCDGGDLCHAYACGEDHVCRAVDTLVSCAPLDGCHLQGVCDPVSGRCSNPVAADGAYCLYLADLCAVNGSCSAGICMPGERRACDDHLGSTCVRRNWCDKLTGLCQYQAAPQGSPCDDHNPCTLDDHCNGYDCIADYYVQYENLNPCVEYVCDPVFGKQTLYLEGPCDDGDYCTEESFCVGGVCMASATNASQCFNEWAPCTADSCFPQFGCLPVVPPEFCPLCGVNASGCPAVACKAPFCDGPFCDYFADDANVEDCVDNNFCNGQEQCVGGVCVRGQAPECDDDNPCTLDLCDPEINACAHLPRTGEPCEVPGDLCGRNATCAAVGQCVAEDRVVCDPPPVCHYPAVCNGESGQCDYAPMPDGSLCDDGNKCTARAVCSSGVCLREEARDLSLHHRGQCWAAPLCDRRTGEITSYALPKGAPCDDGLFCTTADACDGNGNCGGNLTLVLADAEQCAYRICDERARVYRQVVVSDYTPCSTGATRDVCSGPDVCLSGSCQRQYAPATTVCRAANGTCDVPEYCTGCTDACPFDASKPMDTPCLADFACHEAVCFDGDCVKGARSEPPCPPSPCLRPICDESGRGWVFEPLPEGAACSTLEEGETLPQCVNYESCDAYGRCVAGFAPVTKICDDDDACTEDDHCSGVDAQCISGTPRDCRHLDGDCSRGVCDAFTGNCTRFAVNEDGDCNADGDPCTRNDQCQEGFCVAGAALNCSYLTNDCAVGVCRVLSNHYAVCAREVTDPECNPDYCVGGCTQPREFWLAHSRYGHDDLYEPWPGALEDDLICDHPYFHWLNAPPKSRAWRHLFQAWLTATLNQAAGVCLPGPVADALVAAGALLDECRLDKDLATSPDYIALISTINAYVDGATGPGSCLHAVCEDVHCGECDRGRWDARSGVCECFYGWAGPRCSRCDTQPEPGYVMLCVPTPLPHVRYMPRPIPVDDVDRYLDGSVPFLEGTHLPVVYPDTHNLDCVCQPNDDDDGDDPALDHCHSLSDALTICEETWANGTVTEWHDDGTDHDGPHRPHHHHTANNHQQLVGAVIALSVLLGLSVLGLVFLGYRYYFLLNPPAYAPISQRLGVSKVVKFS